MWNPEKIEMYNLFAHKESIYEFKQNKCVMIFGSNQTDRNLENNGAGKTTLFEAICIALTNESLRAIKKDSFINRDEEECKIVFHLYNPVLKMKLRISRQFFRGNKSAKIEIWENDKLNKQVVSVNEANKRVIELIGISREDLLRYFIISQDNRYTFFTASDGEKKEIMNRITSADMINPVIEELDLRYKEKNAEYKEIDDEIGKLSDKKELLVEQREEVLANDNTEEELNELSEKISEAEEEIGEIDGNLEKWKKAVKTREEQIQAITVEDTTQLKKDRKKLKEEMEELDSELSENKRMEKKLKAELEDTITCPNCSHEFIHESELDLSVEDTKSLLAEAQSEIKKQTKKYEAKETKLKNFNKKIKEAERAEELVGEIEEEKSGYERKIKNKTQDRADLLVKIEKWETEKRAIKKRKKDDKLLNSLNQRIGECDTEIEKLTKQLLPISEEMETIKFWQFNMGRSGFMTYLANKSIKIIEGITNSYLRKFGVDISVLINGFTILKSGEVREKIDVFVLNDGVTAEQFLAKSGGERGRVTLAGVLGIQHLINLSTNGRGLNLLCFDECFHGMDSKGQENIIKIFEKMGITILVITQNVSESFNNENTLYVVKEKDVSRYV
jgi:DNA repair exonuclease SbcCD ATPase subunit|nr:MAG TPA: STRUCTURAL MAINTENANCE OF CHROMOSOMES PROTEIN [Caudoviricetes sp.]